MLNNLPGGDNAFSDALANLRNPSFVTNHGNGVLDTNALLRTRVQDPYWGTVIAIQHESTDPREQWADVFANFVAGNIDLTQPSGSGLGMYNFMTSVLNPPHPSVSSPIIQ